MLFYQSGFFFFLSIIGLVLFSLASYFHQIISILGYSFLISYLLIGLVDWIEKKTFFKNRALITLFIFCLIIFVFTAFGTLVVPSLIEQLQLLSEQIPDYFNKLERTIVFYRNKIKELNLFFFKFLNFDFALISNELSSTLNSFSQKVVKNFVSLAFNTISFAVYGLSTIFISIYFILDGPKLWLLITKPLSSAYLKDLEILKRDLSRCLKGFFIGQAQLSSISGIFVFFVYLFFGCKYALLLAIFQAIIEILPVIGGLIGISTGVIVLAFSSPFKALLVFLIYLLYTQIIKDNFLTPKLMGDAIGLHPVFIIISVLIGSKIGGLSGVIFALPVASLLSVIFRHYLNQKSCPKQLE